MWPFKKRTPKWVDPKEYFADCGTDVSVMMEKWRTDDQCPVLLSDVIIHIQTQIILNRTTMLQKQTDALIRASEVITLQTALISELQDKLSLHNGSALDFKSIGDGSTPFDSANLNS